MAVFKDKAEYNHDESGTCSGQNSEMGRLLIVEDDAEIRKILSDFLNENGYEVHEASEGRMASKLMKEETYDLILLDLMLPYVSGDHLIKELREYSNTPVIVLSAKSMMETRLEMLRVGADDYIIKPFDLNEVLVRIQVVLRRSGMREDGGQAASSEGKPAGDVFCTPDGLLRLYAEEHRVVYIEAPSCVEHNNASDVTTREEASAERIEKADSDQRQEEHTIALTAKELQLLQLFLQYPKRTFTKANLYEAVWNDTYYYEDNTINVHMSNLRSKLKKQTGKDYIETVWGIGYRLTELSE